MDAYFDSAIIVKLYVKEATSPDAIRLVSAYTAPYALTQWQTLEVKNAIRLKAFRAEITAEAIGLNQSRLRSTRCSWVQLCGGEREQSDAKAPGFPSGFPNPRHARLSGSALEDAS